MRGNRKNAPTSSTSDVEDLFGSLRSDSGEGRRKNHTRMNKYSSPLYSSDSEYGSFDSTEGSCCTLFGMESSSDKERESQSSPQMKNDQFQASSSLGSQEGDFHDEKIGKTQNHSTEQLSFFTRLKRSIAKLICHEEDEFSITEIDDLDAEILWTSSRALGDPRLVASTVLDENTEPSVSSADQIHKEETLDAEITIHRNEEVLQDHGIQALPIEEKNPTILDHAKEEDDYNDDMQTQSHDSSEKPMVQNQQKDIQHDHISPSLPPPPPPPPPLSTLRSEKKKSNRNKLKNKFIDAKSLTDSNPEKYNEESGYISPESSFEEEEVIDTFLSFLSNSNHDKNDTISVSHDNLDVESATGKLTDSMKHNGGSSIYKDPPSHMAESELNISVTANVGSPKVDYLGEQMQISKVLDNDFRDILIQQEWSNISKSNKKFISPSNSEEENEDATELSTLPDSVGSRSTYPTTYHDDLSIIPRDHQVDLRDIFIEQEGLYGCSNSMNAYLSSDDYDEDEDTGPSTIHIDESHSASKSESYDDASILRESMSEDDSIPDDIMDKVMSALNKAITTTIQRGSMDSDGTHNINELNSLVKDLEGKNRNDSSHNSSTLTKTEALISAAKDLIQKNKSNTSMRRAKFTSQYEDSRDDIIVDHSPKEDHINSETSSTWVNVNGNDRLREKVLRRKAKLDNLRNQLSRAKSSKFSITSPE
jgi:hypothetical protein